MKKELIENNKILLWENRKQKEEIERLNNVINELEKILNARIYNAEGIEETLYAREDKSILNYLQELKDSDKK